jgi:4a-hydroxytetrahydrobiopterin dehydratase
MGTMKSNLAGKRCKPCEENNPPLKGEAVRHLKEKLGAGWKVVNEHHLEKEYMFKNFREALDFTNRLGEVAEQEGHHPDIYLRWDKVRLQIWTHNIDGLSENDFVLAAKADALPLRATTGKREA